MGLAEVDPVVVDPVLEVVLAVRELAERGLRHALGVVEHLAHHRTRRLQAVAGDLDADLALGNRARRKLGAQVAEHLDGDADVALDETPEGLVALTAVEQSHRRNSQPFLIDFGRVRRVRTRDPAADVGLVRGAARERDALAVHEHRLEHEDVGQVHSALERIVQDEHVAFAHVVVVVREHRGERGRDRAEMHRQREGPLCDHVSPCVGHGGGKVHVVPQHTGVGGAAHGHRHLVRGREQGVLEQLEIDRVGVVHHGSPRIGARRWGRPGASAWGRAAELPVREYTPFRLRSSGATLWKAVPHIRARSRPCGFSFPAIAGMWQ